MAIAAKMGMDRNTLARHLSANNPATIIAIARAYGANPITGLVAAGWITKEEQRRSYDSDALTGATTMQLLAELGNRVAADVDVIYPTGQQETLDSPSGRQHRRIAKGMRA